MVMTVRSGLNAIRCQALVHPLSVVVHAHLPAATTKGLPPGGAYGRVYAR